MNIVLFFIFAFLTIFLSIKISKIVDSISRKNKKIGHIISGLLLASITSLPELITSITAVKINNPYLAIGDIIGSNTFNIFMMCVVDIILVKKIFNKTKRYIFEYLVLIIVNLTIIIFLITNIDISLPTYFIFISYFVYIYKVSLSKTKEITRNKKITIKEIVNILTISILLFLSSIFLTKMVNNITIMYPKVSSSVFGAVMLGITTSLPEVITFITLIRLNNYDMAITDILGSNIFNLFVLGINDLLVNNSIYLYMDKSSVLLINISTLITVINFLQNIKKNNRKTLYFVPNIIIIMLYILFCIKGFSK